ncbi:H-NS histone family protein [Burkholderia sp. WSM2232]|uniref:H-NS histone family protein n=1 Tax=Burkholderia sp. WSM2232 TaxID=944436 RepID=UPI00047F1041|nr:H-NS histone family protein [Burkholderia sp. WSM2232]
MQDLETLKTQREILQAQLADIENTIRVHKVAEKVQVIAAIKSKMAAYNITLEELRGGLRKPRRAAPKANRPIRYRNPETGDTWSGRGRRPKWISGNKDIDRFRVRSS